MVDIGINVASIDHQYGGLGPIALSCTQKTRRSESYLFIYLFFIFLFNRQSKLQGPKPVLSTISIK
jgi:hypothetical protein